MFCHDVLPLGNDRQHLSYLREAHHGRYGLGPRSPCGGYSYKLSDINPAFSHSRQNNRPHGSKARDDGRRCDDRTRPVDWKPRRGAVAHIYRFSFYRMRARMRNAHTLFVPDLQLVCGTAGNGNGDIICRNGDRGHGHVSCGKLDHAALRVENSMGSGRFGGISSRSPRHPFCDPLPPFRNGIRTIWELRIE